MARTRWTSPKRGGTRACVDCHKGLAHCRPNMDGIPPG
ncbi:hypothetical protein [Azospirillum argentinense]